MPFYSKSHDLENNRDGINRNKNARCSLSSLQLLHLRQYPFENKVQWKAKLQVYSDVQIQDKELGTIVKMTYKFVLILRQDYI